MYYRVSLTPHELGSAIDPGRFGEGHRKFKPGGPYPVEPAFTELLIEISLESARKAVSPDAPSRLDCIFACETLKQAQLFQAKYRGGQGAIYEIKPTSESTRVFRGNFQAISTAVGAVPYVDYLSDWARGYWTGEPDGIVEILIGGKATVISGPL